MKLKTLVGSGDKIGLFTLPSLLLGVLLNLKKPSVFRVGGPLLFLKVLSLVLLIPGVALWMCSVTFLVTRVPERKLITGGPYAIVKHPLYTSVSFLVLPWVGVLLNTWLGGVLGVILYTGSRLFAPEEEALLAQTFGAAWEDYRKTVRLPWL